MVDAAAATSLGTGGIEAAMFVGAVLLEAVVLYVGYGALERAVGHRVVHRLGGE